MRVLTITNMYPTSTAPQAGIFVEQQIKGLRRVGLDIDLMIVNRLDKGMACYLGLRERIQSRISASHHTLVHVMYGGVMADIVTRSVEDKPTVVTFHGSDLLGEHLSGPLRRVIAHYGVWASRRAARRASRIVTVAKVLREALPNNIDRHKVRIIPCGIDLERFKSIDRRVCQHQLGWDGDSFHVLFPANSGDSVKRFDLAQASVNVLNHSGIKTELHKLQGIANTMVPVWLNASDVLLLTSRHEGSPTVVKEALACDVPIVSVEVGDVKERISGIAGCYIALPNPKDLATKLALVHSGTRRVAGRTSIQELSLESTALKMRNLYEDVVSEFYVRRQRFGHPQANPQDYGTYS